MSDPEINTNLTHSELKTVLQSVELGLMYVFLASFLICGCFGKSIVNLVSRCCSQIQFSSDTLQKERLLEVNQICPICLDLFPENSFVYKLPCNHYYHKHCIESWLELNRICPSCRESVK